MADESRRVGVDRTTRRTRTRRWRSCAAIRAEEDGCRRPATVGRRGRTIGTPTPDPFATFFLDERHAGLFHSVTDCFFNLPERIVPAPDCPEAGLVRLYSDSQGCLHWYLYLAPERGRVRGTSPTQLGGDWVLRQMSERSNWEYDDDGRAGREFWFCAPSFAEFVVRTWLETMAWYSLRPQYAGPAETRGAQAPEVGGLPRTTTGTRPGTA